MNVPNVFEIHEDEINVVCGFHAMFLFFYIKEKFVGPVKILQDQ